MRKKKEETQMKRHEVTGWREKSIKSSSYPVRNDSSSRVLILTSRLCPAGGIGLNAKRPKNKRRSGLRRTREVEEVKGFPENAATAGFSRHHGCNLDAPPQVGLAFFLPPPPPGGLHLPVAASPEGRPVYL